MCNGLLEALIIALEWSMWIQVLSGCCCCFLHNAQALPNALYFGDMQKISTEPNGIGCSVFFLVPLENILPLRCFPSLKPTGISISSSIVYSEFFSSAKNLIALLVSGGINGIPSLIIKRCNFSNTIKLPKLGVSFQTHGKSTGDVLMTSHCHFHGFSKQCAIHTKTKGSRLL